MLDLDYSDEFTVTVEIVDNLFLIEERLQVCDFLNQNFNTFLQGASTNLLINKKSDIFNILGIEAVLNKGLYRFQTTVEITLNTRPETLVVDECVKNEDETILVGKIRLVFGDMKINLSMREGVQYTTALMIDQRQ